jgi:hypothetical protein
MVNYDRHLFIVQASHDIAVIIAQWKLIDLIFIQLFESRFFFLGKTTPAVGNFKVRRTIY